MYWPDGANTGPALQPPAAAAGSVQKFFQDTASPGTIVTADWANMITQEIINCVVAAGETPNKNIFNQLALAIPILAAGTGRTQYAADTGAANAITVAAGSWPGAYAAGQWILVKVAHANTGATTFKVNALAAKPVQLAGAALTGGELGANLIYLFVYDGAEWQLVGAVSSSGPPPTSDFVTGDVKYSAVYAAQTGWYIADGSAINSSTDPALHAIFGANLPDLRGEFIRGADGGRGLDPGRAMLTAQGHAVQSHNHTNGVVTTTGSGSIFPYGTTTADLPGAANNTAHTDSNSPQEQGFTGDPGAGATGTFATETRPTNYSMCPLIKR